MRSLSSILLAASLVLVSVGCSSTPPPNWAHGGAPMVIAPATWHREGDPIVLGRDGKVTQDGDVLFIVDAAGRVYDEDGEPIAVVQPDGYLVGKDNTSMGLLGPVTAAFPGNGQAWLSIGPRGEVTRYDTEGARSQDGYWEGCEGDVVRTCTLVTQVIALRDYLRQPRVSVGIGIGVMMH